MDAHNRGIFGPGIAGISRIMEDTVPIIGYGKDNRSPITARRYAVKGRKGLGGSKDVNALSLGIFCRCPASRMAVRTLSSMGRPSNFLQEYRSFMRFKNSMAIALLWNQS
jgi:hypothetical protein